MIDFSLMILVGFVVIFMAATVQGTTGFGFALTAMPLLSIFISLQSVVPIMVIYGLLVSFFIIYRIRSFVKIRKIWLLIIASIIGTPLGTYLLIIIEQGTLKMIIGIIIILFAILLLRGHAFKVKREKLALLPVGFSSGLLNGSISLLGPPVVLFLTNQGEDKQVFRANITFYGIILNFITVVSFYMNGLVTTEVIHYTLLFLPSLVIGSIVGIMIADKVNQSLFKKITLIIIILSGVSSIISVISQWV